MDPSYERRFKKVKISMRLHIKSRDPEKSQQEKPVQPMVAWKWALNDDYRDNDDPKVMK